MASHHKKFIFYLLTITIFCSACVTVPANRPKHKRWGPIEAPLGENIPQYAIAIDAKYYAKLDRLLPQYKILTIAITNRSLNTLDMDPLKDKWTVQDHRGHRLRAIHSLKISDPQSWNRLTPKMQKLVAYPENSPTGFTQTFDIFLSKKADLEGFRALTYYNAPLRQKFILKPNP